MARPDWIVNQPLLSAVAWTKFQGRTNALAAALGGQPRFFGDGFTGHRLAARPLAYVMKSFQTWNTLSRDNPRTVLVITPPVFAPLVAWLWCLVHRRPLVVDCHTGAFHSPKWVWARPIHRWLLRRVRVVLLHTAELEALAGSWGARALMVPDDLPQAGDAQAVPPAERRRVLIAGSMDSNEPVVEAIEAARLLPDIEFHITGDPELLMAKVRSGAPRNVLFTGFLAYPLFLGEMLAADVVGVFSTDPRIMNRAAFEAVGLGRSLVLSDLPALKERFDGAALFCSNEPDAMAQTLLQGIRDRAEMERRSVALQARLRAQRDEAIARLQSIIDEEGVVMWRHLSAS